MQLANAIPFKAEFTVAKNYQLSIDEGEAATLDVGRWIVEGYASTSDLDTQDHIVTEKAIQSGAACLQKYRTLLFNHDLNRPIGYVDKSEGQGTNLFVKAVISRSEPQIWAKIKDGTLSKFSIFGQILDSEETTQGDKTITLINDLELYEVSLVSVPANVEARSLTWYIEKAMQLADAEPNKSTDLLLQYPSFAKLVSDRLQYKQKQMPIITKQVKATITKQTTTEILQALSLLKQSLEALDGEDKEQVAANIRSLEALLQNSVPQTENDTNKAIVPESEKEVNYMNRIEACIEAMKGLLSDLTGDDANTAQGVVQWLQAMTAQPEKVEDAAKSVAPAETVAPTAPVVVAPIAVDTTGITAAVDELKQVAASVVSSVTGANETLSKISDIKTSIDSTVGNLMKVLDQVPVRKGQTPEVPTDVRTEAVTQSDPLKKAKEVVGGEDKFDKLDPTDKLRSYLHTLTT